MDLEAARAAVTMVRLVGDMPVSPAVMAPEPMAKKRTKPAEKKREDVLTRIGPRALEDAKLAAQYRGITLLEYLTTVVQAAADRDIEEGHARRRQARRISED